MVRSPDSRLQRDFCQMMHAQEQIEHQTWLPLEPQYRDQTALQTTTAGNIMTLDKQGKKTRLEDSGSGEVHISALIKNISSVRLLFIQQNYVTTTPELKI